MTATAEAPTMPVERQRQWRAADARAGGSSSGGGAVYGIGMIGALAYFFGSAETGRDKALAAPKAFVWPALLVYRLLKHLNA